MSKLEEKLKEYQDFELAFLFKYKASSYMSTSLKKIEVELEKRGINSTKVDLLVKEKLAIQIDEHKEKICPRCTSEKITANRVEQYTQSNQHKDEPQYLKHRICDVCDWDFRKDSTTKDRSRRNKTLLWLILILAIVSVIILSIDSFLDSF